MVGLYTEVERSQHLTQSDRDVFRQNYVANWSSVDGPSVFLGEKPDHSAIDFFQRLGIFLEPGAPTKLPAASRREIENSPAVVEVRSSRKESKAISLIKKWPARYSRTIKKSGRDREWKQFSPPQSPKWKRHSSSATTRGGLTLCDPHGIVRARSQGANARWTWRFVHPLFCGTWILPSRRESC